MSSARTSRRVRRSQSPDALPGERPSLRTLVQKRLLDDVFQKASDQFPGWKILIVDGHSMRVISSAVGMYDIMERKVTLVESLEKKRAPFPDMGAIYLLEPTSDNVSKLIADFSDKVLYGNGIFLFFLGRLPDPLLDQIKTCRPLLKRLKALSEVNIDFLAKEERAFVLDMRASFTSFYNRKQSTPVEVATADKLVTVCATLNEYPHIRYRKESAACSSLAAVFHSKMDQFVAQNKSWWYHGEPSKKQSSSQASRPRGERGTLLLLDRAGDCLSPLMHDFTYQSMVHDLLPMEEDRITYQSETTDDPTKTEAKDVLLDERDALWVELRGYHIAKVIETLSERINEIMNSSTGSVLGKKNSGKGGGQMSLSQMATALKALPEYREVMSKLSQHMHISHECMDMFRKENLMELSELEQTLATGKDEDGRSPKLTDMIEQVEEALAKMRDGPAKLRLLLIATVSQGGLKQQDRRKLVEAAELSEQDQRVLDSLETIGSAVFHQQKEQQSRFAGMLGGGRIASSGSSDDEAEYAASRYVPAMKGVLEEWAQDRLSLETYPSVVPMPDPAPGASSSSGGGGRRGGGGGSGKEGASARGSGGGSSLRKSSGATSRWSKASGGGGDKNKRSSGPANFTGGRLIVFSVGGMSFSELRVAREVMEKESREIVAGSTAYVSPKDFVEDLAKLG